MKKRILPLFIICLFLFSSCAHKEEKKLFSLSLDTVSYTHLTLPTT